MLFSKKNRLLIFFLFSVQLLGAQQFPSTQLTTNDGLPNNSIYSIFKDSRGILWLGTSNGISAIRNNQIQNFYTTDGLAHNSCWAIVEDKNHHLWFGSYGGGLTFYDGQRFKVINVAKGLINNQIRTLLIHKNNLYVGTQYGFSVIDINTHQIIYSDKRKGIKNLFQVMNFYVQNNQVHFVTFDDGEWSIDLKKKKIALKNHEIPHVYSLYSSNSRSYISHLEVKENYFNQFSIRDDKDTIINRFLTKSIYWDYAKDKRDIIYAAGNGINFASGGVYQLSQQGFINRNKEFGIPSFNVWSLDYDSQLDLLYVGTLDKGLYIIDLKSHLLHYSSSYLGRDELEVINFSKLKDLELLLSQNELLFIKRNKIEKEITRRQLYNFLAKQKLKWNHNWNFFYKSISFEQFELKDLKIFDSSIWLNTNLGLIKITTDGEIKASYLLPVKEFFVYQSNQLFFQQPFGKIYKLDEINQYKPSEYYGEKSIKGVRDIIQFLDFSNKKWALSSSQGLYSFQNEDFYSYSINNIWSEKELVCGTFNSKANLLVANARGDVFVLEVSPQFKILNKIPAQKLLGRSISFIKSYKDYIIIGNEKGLVFYKDGEIRLLDEDQGLTNKIIKTAFLDGNILIIGTLNGYFKLDLKKFLSVKQINPRLKVSNIVVNYSPISSTNFNWFEFSSQQLELPYSENTLSVDFEPYQTAYPNKLRYSYKLEGMEKPLWSNWSTSKSVNLSYLPAGIYDLQVRIKDLNSGKITQTKLLNIKISPPLWKTWWFILISTVTIVLLLYYVVKQRVKLIKREEQEKSAIQKRLIETKMEALQSQMNPHFIFNAMNSIQLFILEKNTEEALQYMAEFSKLIRMTLNHSSKLRISLEDELKYLKSYIALENLRFNKRVYVKIELDENIDPSKLEIPPMLIQPFVENAFVHAFNSKSINPELSISFTLEPDFLICAITDNGKGMDAGNRQKLHQSKGIHLVKERLSLLQANSNYAVEFSSVIGQGTRVVVRVGLI